MGSQEEPFSGLVDLWSLLCATSTGLLVTTSVLEWSAMRSAHFTGAWLTLSLSTAIAVTTEVRFFLGHRNYLRGIGRHHRAELPQWRRAQCEFLLICLLKLFQFAMALTIASPVAFLNAFVGLMFCDLIWIPFEPRVRSLENVKTFKPCRWMWINLATALLILIGSRFTSTHGVELCAIGIIGQLIIAATNCLADLCSCIGPVDR